MLSVDTNILVRFLVTDHPQQSAQAGELIQNNRIWIAKSVLLETEWVLRDTYAFSPGQVASAFRDLSGLPQVEIEDDIHVAQAIDWLESGIDFADALHLASSQSTAEFVTFDRKFAANAAKLTAAKVRTLR